MIARAVALALCCLAAPLSAANWATKAVCDIPSLDLPAAWADRADIAAAQARAAGIPNGLGKFWRITAPDGAVSHLFGTMHSNEPLLLDLPGELSAALNQARIIATEVDFRLPARRFARNDPVDSYRWRSARSRNAEPPFEPELADWVREFFSGQGLQTPWTFLTDAGLAERLLHNPCNDFNAGVFPVMDDLIALEGVLAGATFLGLESQGAFLTELSRPSRAAQLHGILQVYGAYTQPPADNQGRQAFAALYAQGRLGEMMAHDALYLEAVFGPERGAKFRADAERYLIRDRNLAWLGRIGPELDRGGVVMAVGAFHLPGEDGLVARLRAQGYSVSRIVAEGEVLR
ncbi:MAG: TraB/GumN family protein [Pseudomonadota bacterium]